MSETVEGVAAEKRRKRWLTLALILLILALGLLVPLINIGRYHRTIADSLTRSLGHSVYLGSVQLEVFPWPGLEIHDLVVEEDPSFGAEPLLRAPSVSVHLRLSSLWRQRLEVSRIDLDQASVNLVRDKAGRWNFGSLLLQASRTPNAPTAQRHSSAELRFPYIEFSSARINFKEGYEKKAFSLFDTDASIWQADPNRWRIRLEAQPARTDLDLDLEDAGTMRLDGSVERAASLEALPMKLHAEWTGAQLGQVSRLTLGRDSGWRGDLRVDADFSGPLDRLEMKFRTRVSDAHLQEFTPLQQLNIEAQCQAVYENPQRSLNNLTCLWPTGDGHLLLTGSVPNLEHPKPQLTLEINHTPVSFAVSLLGLLRRGLPSALDASGTINGQFSYDTANTPSLAGHAAVDSLQVSLQGAGDPFRFPVLQFATPPVASPKPHRRKRLPQPTVPVNAILLEPAAFAAGGASPMQVSGQLTRSGFSAHLTGQGSLDRLQPASQSLELLRHSLSAVARKGMAEVNLTVSGSWMASIDSETRVSTLGSIRLQHAQAQMGWLAEPLTLENATVQLANDTVTWSNADFTVDGVSGRGSARYGLSCNSVTDGCPAEINLDFPALDAAKLRSVLLGTNHHDELLQAILSHVESQTTAWPALHGTVHADTFTVGPLALKNVRSLLSLENHELHLTSLDAETLGGSAHFTGTLASDSSSLDATWSGVNLTQAAALFHEKWGTGSLDGHTNVRFGDSDPANSATGTFQWTLNGNWTGAALLQIALPKPKSAFGSKWSASGTIGNSSLTLETGPARGTLSFNRDLDLTWTPAHAAGVPVHLSGTLAHPKLGEKTTRSPNS